MKKFSLHRRLHAFRFEEVDSFVRHSRQGMRTAWKQFTKDFDKATAGWSESQVSDYVDHNYDDMAMLRDESPQLLRQAQCMVVYGTFENGLAKLCRAVHRDGQIATTPPSKLYMDDVKGYLRPHIRDTPKPFASDWQWMHEFRIIRNWLAHNGGVAQPDIETNGNWATANRFLRRNRGLIKFVRWNEIQIEDGLVDRAIRKATDATNRLERALQVLYQ